MSIDPLLGSGTRRDGDEVGADVGVLIDRAHAAMAAYAEEICRSGQPRIDEAVSAVAWSLYRPDNARRFAELAVAVTGMGDVESKVIKNQRKTFGTLRDLLAARSTGIIETLPEQGIVKYAKPVGVVGALTPSTNPSATPVNNAMMAVKGGNAIIIAPPPGPGRRPRRWWRQCARSWRGLVCPRTSCSCCHGPSPAPRPPA